MTVTDEELAARMTRMQETLEAHQKAVAAVNEALCARHLFQPGDVLRNDRGHEVRVARLSVSYGKVKMFGTRRLKSGVFSSFETELNEWNGWAPRQFTIVSQGVAR